MSCARTSSVMAGMDGTDVVIVPCMGPDDGGGAAAGASAPPLRPGSFTAFWHFGQRTLNGRSGTLESSMAIFCEHCGQLACTLYLSIRSSNSESERRGPEAGLAAGAGRRGAGADVAILTDFTFSSTPAPCVSRRSWRFVRFVA